jgi:hypothetical protein
MSDLKYLFRVTYKDGSVSKQTKDDISALDPKRSCFYDVVQKLHEVWLFELIETIPILPKKYAVDLITGEFSVNGQRFQLGWNNIMDVPPDVALPPFKLIFYTQVKRHTRVTYQVKTGNILKQEPAGFDKVYFIGWEAKDNKGRNIKRTIGIE